MPDAGVKPPVTQINVSLVDYDDEKTSFRLFQPEVLEDGSNYGPITGDEAGGVIANNHITGLRTYLSPFIIGNFNTITVITDRYDYDPTPPSDPFAQRETAFILSYRDTTTMDIHRAKIGTANLDKLAPLSDKVSPLDAQYIALVAFLEANFVSPEGNPIQVLEMRHAGVNN